MKKIDNEGVEKLYDLGKELINFHEWDETSDGSADTGMLNSSMQGTGHRLLDLLDELTGAPRCASCHGFVTERPDGQLRTRGDIVPGYCLWGYAHGGDGKHRVEEVTGGEAADPAGR